MKKTVVIFATFIVLMLGFASAEQVQSDDDLVLFRGIEWGTTYGDAISQIPEITYWSRDDDYASKVEDTMVGKYNPIYDDYVRMSAYGKPSDTMTVAGYEVSNISLWFAYTPNEDGELEKNLENTAFYLAQYTIKAKSISGVAGDLVQKLTSLYGEVSDEVYDTAFYSGMTIHHIWKVSNDRVWVSLSEKSLDDRVYILYGFIEGDEYLHDAYNALVMMEKKNFGSDNTDGL